jgi:hypothetical protein
MTMAKAKKRAQPAPLPKSEADDIVAPAIPTLIPPAPQVKPDLSEPWYRPAKHYIRRQQWHASILQLLNRLPQATTEEDRVLHYVGLPGQHHLDLLGMRGICRAKSLRVRYLGFRTGNGAPPEPTLVDQLIALSSTRYHTPDSIVVPDSIENIGQTNTQAYLTFQERGPFDVINLDVNGGVLHGDPVSLLNAIKAIMLLQNPRPDPWLFFLTTIVQPEVIQPDVMTSFFKTISDNCDQFSQFKENLAAACGRNSFDLEAALANPASLSAPALLRFFTLAFGKWMLVNLTENNPRAIATLQSAYLFRNTNRERPEMLSLAYFATPILQGGGDPTGLTSSAAKGTSDVEYAQHALKLVAPSLDGMKDLDEVWDNDATVKNAVVAECEGLLQMIGVDEQGLRDWRIRYNLATQPSM